MNKTEYKTYKKANGVYIVAVDMKTIGTVERDKSADRHPWRVWSKNNKCLGSGRSRFDAIEDAANKGNI